MSNIERSPKPVSPTRGEKPSKIEAKTVFDKVKTEVTKKKGRASTARKDISRLKDKRGFFRKLLFGFAVQQGDAEELRRNYTQVRKDFRKYEEVGISIPKDISKVFEEGQSGKKNLKEKEGEKKLSDNPEYLTKAEAKKLEKLAYEAERKLEFRRQLEDRKGLAINGNLTDVFEKGEEITENKLLGYCVALKKLLVEKNAFPDLVTSDPDPRKFIFFYEYEGDEPKTLKVKTEADLLELQKRLNECSAISSNSDFDMFGQEVEELRKEKIEFDASDPFGIKEGAAKKQIIADIGRLSVDNRGLVTKLWDNAWGAVGSQTANMEKLREQNRMRLESVAAAFDGIVQREERDNESFQQAVLDKLPKSLQEKLKSGERLTTEEVNQLQYITGRAMQKQRYINELKSMVPARIEGNLKAEFDGKMPDAAIFDKYLHQLKEELIKGKYPSLVTSHPNVRTFQFVSPLPGGKIKEITVNSLKDLDQIEKLLKECRDFAKGSVPEELKSRNVLEQERRVNEERYELIGKTYEEILSRNKELESENKELESENKGLEDYNNVLLDDGTELRGRLKKEVANNVSNEAKIKEQELIIEDLKSKLKIWEGMEGKTQR